MPTMSILATFLHVLWNAFFVFLQVMRSAIQEAKQEATEVVALLDDDASTMDAITSTSLLESAASCQMLVIARASSFVLLLRLSERRVLHLEVDEWFVVAKLEVIQTELTLHIQHVPRLLQAPIGIHDTRLVRYTPMKLPYLWKEEQAVSWCGDGVVGSSVPAASASPVSARTEGRSRRKKCVQLLKEGALRRRVHMDHLEHVGLEAGPMKVMGVTKTRGKRKALSNATNTGTTHAEGSTGGDKTSDETQGLVADTPRQVRVERSIRAALSENLSIPNMVQAASLGKAVEGMQQPRSTGSQSLRRRRSQFDLYAQGAQNEFSLLQKMHQGRD